MLSDQLIKHANLIGRTFVTQTKKNDAVVRTPFAKYLFSKAAIVSDQNASFNLRNLDNPIIVNTACLIIN